MRHPWSTFGAQENLTCSREMSRSSAVAHGVQALLEAPPDLAVPILATGPVSRLAHLRPLALPLSFAQDRPPVVFVAPSSGAADARQRRRDKHRRRARRVTKRSMWREIQFQALAPRAMWTCCADSSSDEHNTCNTLLLLFADALVAPALLADLSEVDQLMVALYCRFALAQQDRPPSRTRSSGSRSWMRHLALRHGLAWASRSASGASILCAQLQLAQLALPPGPL